VVVVAALEGSPEYLARVRPVQAGLDEPYRSVLAEVLRLKGGGGYLDLNVLGAALLDRHLVRTDGNGRTQPLTAGQVLSLLGKTNALPEQPEAYLDLLHRELRRRRQAELQALLQETVRRLEGQPERLFQELARIAGTASRFGGDPAAEYPSEILEVVPYAKELHERHRGLTFEGLDSGFEHLNHLCNGLGLELFVLVAPPGEGKTTLCWQVCCQAAGKNQVPVVVVSLEQSK
jgi:replicative DNA helicase